LTGDLSQDEKDRMMEDLLATLKKDLATGGDKMLSAEAQMEKGVRLMTMAVRLSFFIYSSLSYDLIG
jgi:hypothetical protein